MTVEGERQILNRNSKVVFSRRLPLIVEHPRGSARQIHAHGEFSGGKRPSRPTTNGSGTLARPDCSSTGRFTWRVRAAGARDPAALGSDGREEVEQERVCRRLRVRLIGPRSHPLLDPAKDAEAGVYLAPLRRSGGRVPAQSLPEGPTSLARLQPRGLVLPSLCASTDMTSRKIRLNSPN